MTCSVTTWCDARRKPRKSAPSERLDGAPDDTAGDRAPRVTPLHIREHGSLLAAAERTALLWMAQRMPQWANSDHLTVLGFLAMLSAGIAYAAASRNRWALLFVAISLALNWFGDSMDGTLARVRDRQRPRYGFYVDHVLDMVGTFCLIGGLAFSGYMNPLVALALLAVFLTVAAEEFLATHVRRVFRLSFLRFGPTELRVILSVGTLYLLYRPWVGLGNLGTFRLFDVGGVVAIAGLAIKLTVSAIGNTRALYLEERLPR